MGISDWSSDVCSSDLVIDHAAEAGSGLRDTDTLHRIDPAIVKQQVVAAGFEFVGESPVLANAQDDQDRKSTRLTPVTTAHLVCRLLLVTKKSNSPSTQATKPTLLH